MAKLTLRAGARALRRVREHGLSPDDVTAVFGASGAAKWLTIYGLDHAIFTRFLDRGRHEVDLFGTSIGAFKLAAAAQDDPGAALDRLAQAYIAQRYPSGVTPQAIAKESAGITRHMLGDRGVAEILGHPRYRFHCGTVRCRGALGSDHTLLQRVGVVGAFLRSGIGRRHLRGVVRRAVFSDPRRLNAYPGADDFPTEVHPLTAENFDRALLASGSIPVIMPGVTGLPGAGTYRDGGLLDYHPVPGNLTAADGMLVLYPHFYPHLIEGWFDKFRGASRVPGGRLDDVLLIAPSDDYVASLPGRRIPDRKDFVTLAGDDDERQRRWREAVERSLELGEEFLALVDSDAIRDAVEPFPVR